MRRLEGACKSDAVIKNDIFLILNRMMQEGLMLEDAYKEVVYTSSIFY